MLSHSAHLTSFLQVFLACFVDSQHLKHISFSVTNLLFSIGLAIKIKTLQSFNECLYDEEGTPCLVLLELSAEK